MLGLSGNCYLIIDFPLQYGDEREAERERERAAAQVLVVSVVGTEMPGVVWIYSCTIKFVRMP
jgi:hypothetical protein